MPASLSAGPAPLRIRLAGQSIRLLPERCAYWEEREMLILSDLHLGKSATFRHHGLAVPEGDTADDLARLDRAIEATRPLELMIVGDLFHAASGRSAAVVELFAAWRQRNTALKVQLIVGNHDRNALPPQHCQVEVAGHALDCGLLQFVHDPADANPSQTSVCGHVHPVVALGPGGKLRAACFWQRPQMLVLPSFGGFTGGATIKPTQADVCHAIADGRIHSIPATVLLRL